MKLRLISIAFVAAMSAGCASYRLPVVGHYDTYSEVLTGEVTRDLQDDSEIVALTLDSSAVTCEGRLYPPDDGWPNEFPLPMRGCLNRLARGTLTCSDGRTLELDWRATQCRTAVGAGFDRDGGILHFMVVEDTDAADLMAAQLTTQSSPNPPLPLAASHQ